MFCIKQQVPTIVMILFIQYNCETFIYIWPVKWKRRYLYLYLYLRAEYLYLYLYLSSGYLYLYLMTVVLATSLRTTANSSQPLSTGDFAKFQNTRTSLGDRSFTAAGPRLWNNLPLHLNDFELSLFEFRRLLKTHLFGWWSQCLVTYFRCSALYKCTYILTYLMHIVLVNDNTGAALWRT